METEAELFIVTNDGHVTVWTSYLTHSQAIQQCYDRIIELEKKIEELQTRLDQIEPTP